MSQTSIKSDPTKTYCTLRETFDLVGKKVCGPKWQGFEADCDPARADQRTDTRSLLRKLAPDGQSFSTKEKDRRPVPKRPIDDKDGAKLEQAIARHTAALNELLRFLHRGLLPIEFIADDGTTEPVRASKWPDPAKFDPREPTWGDLWFNIATGRVVLKPPETSATSIRVRDYGGLWWAYEGRAGHVEIDREALVKLLMPPKDKDPRKRNRGAEADAILKNRIEMVKAVARTEWADKNKRPGWKTMARHLEETQGKKLGYERGAIRLILKGTYKASKRLGIPGL